jgi:uncharacterized membrane protein SpoIIM required for sporulation
LAEFRLKSYHFRREREQTWQTLDALVSKAEKRGIKSLSPAEIVRLPMLYFATLSSLSVARNISLDQNVVDYLESISGRAYFLVYGARANLWPTVAGFFHRRFPAAVRELRWNLLISALTMGLGLLAGYVLVLGDSEWYYTFVSADIAQGRTPTASTASLREVLFGEADNVEALSIFATFLFTHNAKIGMMCFALGFALGIPTIFLLAQNGMMLGAMAALYASRGLGAEFCGWILIHGVTELLAIVLCAAAGLAMGAALAFPGQHGRLANLAIAGRKAGMVVIGSVVMFLIAGLLEGLGRQLITDTSLRFMIAAATALLFAVYFLFAGRDHGHGRED